MTTGQMHLSEDDAVPLVVDLDGTVIRSDLLVESAFAYLGADPLRIFPFSTALFKGKASLKAEIARHIAIDVAHLPYDHRVLDLVREARGAGRPIHLTSSSNERYVSAVAQHLGLFDGWLASNEKENITSAEKAKRLIRAFGEKRFDYVGNDGADLPIWSAARKSIAVQPSKGVRRALSAIDSHARILDPTGGQLRDWIKLIRLHQWAKNALVFVPLLTAHHFDPTSLLEAMTAFFSFSFAASSIYVINDLVDLGADRKHPTKRYRPLACGTVPIREAMILALALAMIALVVAVALGPRFLAVLCTYLAITLAYSFLLKRKMIIDVIALAALYTLRVIGGAAAISVPISEWLLGFSMFTFTALALIKRYTELATRLDADLPDPSNRGYRKTDLVVVSALAAAASFNAVTVFALYISSDTVRHLYRHPSALWLVCPLLMYWLGRALLMAHRRVLDDDPIVFALRDRNTLLTFALIGAIMIAAI